MQHELFEYQGRISLMVRLVESDAAGGDRHAHENHSAFGRVSGGAGDGPLGVVQRSFVCARAVGEEAASGEQRVASGEETGEDANEPAAGEQKDEVRAKKKSEQGED